VASRSESAVTKSITSADAVVLIRHVCRLLKNIDYGISIIKIE
jgi:hypothetical protein